MSSQPIDAEQLWKWHKAVAPRLYPGVSEFRLLPPLIRASYHGMALGIARHTEQALPEPPLDVPESMINQIVEVVTKLSEPAPELPDTPPRK